MSTLTIPFTYILKFKPTNQWYYGVRWAKGCQPADLWSTYFSSSAHIKKLIKQFGPESFDFRISRTFSSKSPAIKHERKFLLKVNAVKNGAFINKRNNMPDFSPAGLTIIHHPVYNFETWHDPKLPIPNGWKLGVTDSHKRANSSCRIGRPPWNKGKSTGSTGPCSYTRKLNISKSRLLTKKFLCNYCNKEIDPANYKRFHGNNCKNNPNVDLTYWKKISQSNKLGMQKQIASGRFNNFGRNV